MADETRYTFWYRKPSGESGKSGASPTMTGVREMVAGTLHRNAEVPLEEAYEFADAACEQWREAMRQRMEHSSGWVFHLGPRTITRRGFN